MVVTEVGYQRETDGEQETLDEEGDAACGRCDGVRSVCSKW